MAAWRSCSTFRLASSSCLLFSCSFRCLSCSASRRFLSAMDSGVSSMESSAAPGLPVPLQVLTESSAPPASLGMIGVSPSALMASWKMVTASCGSALVAASTASPSLCSASASFWRQTSLTCSRLTNSFTGSCMARRRCRRFFTSALAASFAAFSWRRRSASALCTASSASLRTRSASSRASCTARRASSSRAFSAFLAAFLASFSARMRGSLPSARLTSSAIRSDSARLYFLATRPFSRCIQRFSSRHSASSRSWRSSPSAWAMARGSRQLWKENQKS
mmetsp:Transcript_71688/g.202371  ORF Transcript_71688/g.202371 Transcript_71688/m.202371 type:complete len:279 (+) Transcript_71688:1036-1872(+)